MRNKQFLYCIITFMKGVLPYQELVKLVDRGVISVSKEKIKPSSIDLPVADEIYEISSAFLPSGKAVRSLLEAGSLVKPKRVDFTKPLKKGHTYLVRLDIDFDLTDQLWGTCSPKSSIGRVDMHVRIIADGVRRFDFIPRGYTGTLWALVTPHSFDIKLGVGVSLSQARIIFEDMDWLTNPKDVQKVVEFAGIVKGPTVNIDELDGGILLSVDLSGEVDAWVPKETAPVLDLTAPDKSLNPADYWVPVKAGDKKIKLEKDKFYILSILEGVRIPPYLAAEFVAVDTYLGEFRSHYAGFVDPGWGLGEELGRPLTLELRPYEDLVIAHGQSIAKLVLYKLLKTTEVTYDSGQADAHYRDQWGPRLAKYFRR